MLRAQGRDLHAEFLELLPERPTPISIQRFSLRRFGLALLVLLVMVVVQQLDNQLVSPLVMGRNVQVHPLVVLLALAVAGAVYGILGLLIAVPAVAAGNVLATHFWQTRVPWAATNGEPPSAEPVQPPAQPQRVLEPRGK
jgi:predicted PurR-regulated permease PerM